MADGLLDSVSGRDIALVAYALLIIGLGTYHRWLWTHNDPRSKVVLVVSLIVIAPAFIYLDGGDDDE